MKSWFMNWVLGCLVVSLALPAFAADKEKKKDALPGPLAMVQSKVAELELKDEQKEKIKTILHDAKEKFAAAAEKMSGSLTKEQHKAMQEAMKQPRPMAKKELNSKQPYPML